MKLEEIMAFVLLSVDMLRIFSIFLRRHRHYLINKDIQVLLAVFNATQVYKIKGSCEPIREYKNANA